MTTPAARPTVISAVSTMPAAPVCPSVSSNGATADLSSCFIVGSCLVGGGGSASISACVTASLNHADGLATAGFSDLLCRSVKVPSPKVEFRLSHTRAGAAGLVTTSNTRFHSSVPKVLFDCCIDQMLLIVCW